MPYSTDEQIAHVLRRLGMGANPQLVGNLAGPDEAIAAALDLSSSTVPPPPVPTPTDLDEAREQRLGDQLGWWLGRMASGERLIEERLVWFWMDHFATSRRKVPASNLLWQQHLTIRAHCTGSFADLLHAIAVDPAMLVYLDGVRNEVGSPNENFAREVMELHALGEGRYSQQDVVEAARAFTGWVVHVPGTRPAPQLARLGIEPWESGVVEGRHDAGSKTILGSTRNHDAGSTIDVILEEPRTAEFVAAKLFRELVGLEPSVDAIDSLASGFRADYQVLPLVEEIVARPELTSIEALRTRVRTPLEKAATLLQAYPGDRQPAQVARVLRGTTYFPFLPPNPAGYAKGEALMGPYQLTHTLDLLWLLPQSLPVMTTTEALSSLGVHDAGPTTVEVVDRFDEPHSKLASVLASPEFVLT